MTSYYEEITLNIAIDALGALQNIYKNNTLKYNNHNDFFLIIGAASFFGFLTRGAI